MNRYCVKVAGVARQGAGYNLILRVPEQTARLIRQQAEYCGVYRVPG